MRFLILGLLLCLMVNGKVLANDILTIGSTGTLANEICLAVVKEAYNQLGYEVVSRKLPVKRTVFYGDLGEIDGLFGNANEIQNYGLTNMILIPVQITELELVAVAKGNTLRIQGIESLRPYRIGIRDGYKSTEKMFEGFHIEKSITDISLLNKLDAGRIDVVISDRLKAKVNISSLGLDDLVIVEPPLFSMPFFHYVHNSKAYLANELEMKLHILRQTGRIDQIAEEVVRQRMENGE